METKMLHSKKCHEIDFFLLAEEWDSTLYFEKEISGYMEYLYFIIVTISTVGHGDI